MIQRIQSLYLLLATAACASLFFLPVASSGQYEFSIFGLSDGTQTVIGTHLLLALCGLLALAMFVTIFLFKKRVLQIRLTAVTVLVYIVFIAILFYYSDKASKMLDDILMFGAGAYISLIPLMFLILAHRSIRRDEKMVRETSRLR